jgi:hypothetical protein
VREAISFHPAEGQWVAATQAAIAVMVLPSVFALQGNLRTGLLGSFGALIVLYLSDRSRRERAVKLPVIAACFIATTLLGTLTGGTLLGSLGAVCAVAVLFSFLSVVFNVGPPGAVFPVLIAGTAGQLAAPEDAGGESMDPWQVVLLVALGVLVGYVVVVLPLAIPAVRERDRAKQSSFRWTLNLSAEGRRIFSRLTAGVIAAVGVGGALGLHHIGWVLLPVFGTLQKDANVEHSTVRMVQRLIATVLGIGLAVTAGAWTPEGDGLIVVVGVLTFGFVALLPRNLLFALATITPMALVLAAGGNRDGLTAAAEVRASDTAAGAVIATAILVAVALWRWRTRARSVGEARAE